MTTGSRIKQLRESHGMTQVELAQIAGVTDKAVSTWENGANNPRMGAIERMAEYFGVKKGYLIGDTDAPAEPSVPANLIPAGKIGLRRVPILGDTAAGLPLIANREYDEYVEVPDEGQHYDAALRVVGDSMEPLYLDGDLVFIRYANDVDDGRVAAICLDDEVTLKRIYHIPGGVQLLSENHKYPPMIYMAEDVSHAHLVGLAVGFLRWVE